MTSTHKVKKYLKFEDKQCRFCGQRGGRGSIKSKNSVDVINGSSLKASERNKERGKISISPALRRGKNRSLALNGGGNCVIIF